MQRNNSKNNGPRRNSYRRRNRTGMRNNTRAVSGPPENAIGYFGPSILPRGVRPDLFCVELHYYQAAVSTGAGVYDTCISSALTAANANGVGVSNSASWATVSGLYREYRVLSIRSDFTPAAQGALPNAAATFTQPIATVVDRDDSTASGAYANIVSNESLRLHTLTQPFTRIARMESTDESSYVLVSTSSGGFMTIKVLATGIGAPGAATFGAMLYRWVVQFRTYIG